MNSFDDAMKDEPWPPRPKKPVLREKLSKKKYKIEETPTEYLLYRLE